MDDVPPGENCATPDDPAARDHKEQKDEYEAIGWGQAETPEQVAGCRENSGGHTVPVGDLCHAKVEDDAA